MGTVEFVSAFGDAFKGQRDVSRDEIFQHVKKLLVEEFELSDHQITLSSHLVDNLDLDSIDAVALAVRVEEESGCELGAEELESLQTVENVVDLIEAMVARPRR